MNRIVLRPALGIRVFACVLIAIHSLVPATMAHADVTGGTVVAGQATISQNGAVTNINSTTDRTIINWNGFSLNSSQTANFLQPSATSAVLNRVTTPNNPSAIYGTINSNGNVILVNPSGIVVGAGGMINTNGFTASVLDIPNNEFLQGGVLNFRGDSTASVINQGTINTGAGGVALIGGDVINEGTITSEGGAISLVTGGSVTLADGSRFTHADMATLEAGLSPYAGVIQNSGTIRATGAIESGGEVYLVNPGGKIMHDGTIAARVGNQGGSVDIAANDGGTATVSGQIDASGDVGGRVVVQADHLELASATIDVSGTNGGGSVNLGGGLQGLDDAISNAKTTTFDEHSVVRADAIELGGGGNVVIWSDEATDFGGTISATGGANGGDGGLVEVSGTALAFYGSVDTSAAAGQTGWLLLDPVGIRIVSGPNGRDGIVTGTDPILQINDGLLNSVLMFNNILLATSPTQADIGPPGDLPSGRGGSGPNDDNSVVDRGTAINTGGNTLFFSTGTVDLYADIVGNVAGGLASGASLPAPLGPVKDPTVVNVFGSGDLATGSIQDGVDIVGVGGQVNVGDGTFAEAVVIDKALSIIGTGPTDTTIIEVASNSAGMTVTAGNVNIDGFRFERDGNASNAVGIRLDGRNGTTGNAISNIFIGDTDDPDTLGNLFVDLLSFGVQALGDVDNVTISDNVFGFNDGAVGDQNDPNRIRRGIVSRVERGGSSGNNVIDGDGNVLGAADQGPFSDWRITDNEFTLRRFASTNGTAIDLEGASGSAVDAFEISGNTINDSTFGIHVVGAGGPGSGSPYPLSNNILIDNNTINGLVSTGIGIRVGANIDSISPNNDRSRMSDINITGNTINNTDTGIDVTGVTFMTMSDVVVDNNTINNADVRGIRLNITGRLRSGDPDWTGFVISNNDVNVGSSGTGLLIDYRLNSEVEIGSGNRFDGGVNGIVINGRSGRALSLVGNTLNDTVFSNQSANFIELQDTALFDPDEPTVIDATGVDFDGLDPNIGIEAIAIEDQIVHFLDDNTLGLLDYGAIAVPNGGSIQQAVNAAGLLPGASEVLVGSGTFGGSVEVWVDGLKISGVDTGGGAPVVDTNAVDAFSNFGTNIGVGLAI
ncbi:MAG: filamentous hemagglutinin N-terminal domain-containing protein, partial [Pirellulales bacterium]|nr:filamentous hemagglutinin N-terminal domain-containing protein [Pirellulales bacterium]